MELSDLYSQPPRAITNALSDQREIDAFKHWRSNAGTDLHSTFSEDREYDRQRATWRAPFTQDLETILSSAQQLDPSLEFTDCTWDSLISHIDTALESDDQKSRNNKLRRVSRNAKADVQLLNSLASIIPDEKGLKLLRGGLSLIFQAWVQRIETRERVLSLLAEIVELFAFSSAQKRAITDDANLQALLFDLYGVMLDAISELISILLRTHKGNLMQRLRKKLPPHEAQQVEKITTSIENVKNRLASRMQILSLERDADVYRNTRAIKAEVQATRYHVSNMEMNINSISRYALGTHHTTERIYAQNQGLHTQLLGVSNSINDAAASIESYVDASVARQFEQWKQEFSSSLLGIQKENKDLAGMIQTSMYQFMGERMNSERLEWLPRAAPTPQPLTYRTQEVPLDQLVHVLDVDPTPMLEETKSLLRLTRAMQPEGLQKVRGLVSTEHFHNWANLPFPNVLLVDGHCRELGQGRTSPLSIFCASLAATLAQSESNIVLHFFCSHHVHPHYDATSGPAGLLRSLITQAILYPNACNAPAVAMEQSMWEAVTRHEVVALIDLFEQIVLSLVPSKTIYVVLDNICDFQSSLYGYSQDILHILRRLHQVADERRTGSQLKLLLTSANRTMDMPNIVRPDVGEYVELFTASAGRRLGSMRGGPFEGDIRMVMQSPRDADLLNPFDQRGRMFMVDGKTKNGASSERPRSLGRFM